MKILNDIKYTLILLCFTIGITEAQVKILSLEESIEIGLKNSKELQISNSIIARSDADVSQISSTMLPKFSIKGNYARLSDVPPFQ
ncbi:MAG: hypothetical protein R3250_03820, partial [Melioribacteraceae bacterium]|nr:hypothetical protein [Melioribacteraceae bacterium]